MYATGVTHIAICVADIDRSLGFYRDILGMTVGYDRIQDTTTGGLPHVYKHSRQTRMVLHFLTLVRHVVYSKAL